MDDLVLVKIICIISFAIIDMSFITFHMADSWLKKRKIEEFFPEWKKSKKSYLWFLIWSFLLLLNCGIMSLSFLFTTLTELIILAGASFLYIPFIGLLNIIVKYNIRHIYNKKN